MKHVAHGQIGLSFGVDLPVLAKEIAVAADDLLGFGIPYDQLLAAVWHRVELIDIDRLACTATRRTEGNLTQTPYLLHHVRRFRGTNDINLVVALVGCTQTALRSQFTFQQFLADGLDNLFFHFC